MRMDAHFNPHTDTYTHKHQFDTHTSYINHSKVIAAYGNSMVLTEDGNAWAAGANNRGQLGDGNDGSSSYYYYDTGTPSNIYVQIPISGQCGIMV